MNVICFDAGFVNLGWVVAGIHKRSEPDIVDCGVFTSRVLSPKERRRRGLTKAHQNIARIEEQAHFIDVLHDKWQPSAYFIEVPHGGAKGAIAIRSMAYAKATIVTALKLKAAGCAVVYMLPTEVKDLVAGKPSASKEFVEAEVRNFWPNVDWGKFGAKSNNMIDAAAVCMAARKHQTFRALALAC